MPRKRARLDFKNEADEVASRFLKEKELWKKERLQALKSILPTTNSVETKRKQSPPLVANLKEHLGDQMNAAVELRHH